MLENAENVSKDGTKGQDVMTSNEIPSLESAETENSVENSKSEETVPDSSDSSKEKDPFENIFSNSETQESPDTPDLK